MYHYNYSYTQCRAGKWNNIQWIKIRFNIKWLLILHRFISWANILPSFMKKTCCCFQQTLLVLNPLLLCLYIMLRKRSSLRWCFIWFHMNVDAVSQCESYYKGHFLHSVQCSIIKRNKGKIKMKKSGIFYVFHLYLVILKNSRCESSLSHRFDLLFFIC